MYYFWVKSSVTNIFAFNFFNFCVTVPFFNEGTNVTVLLKLVSAVFVARLLVSGILFSTVVNSVFVANPLILGILFSTEVNAVSVAKLLVSGTLFSKSVIFAL